MGLCPTGRDAVRAQQNPKKPAQALGSRASAVGPPEGVLPIGIVWETADETAGLIGITTRTVNLHLETSRPKLGAENATHSVASALHLGLIAT